MQKQLHTYQKGECVEDIHIKGRENVCEGPGKRQRNLFKKEVCLASSDSLIKTKTMFEKGVEEIPNLRYKLVCNLFLGLKFINDYIMECPWMRTS